MQHGWEAVKAPPSAALAEVPALAKEGPAPVGIDQRPALDSRCQATVGLWHASNWSCGYSAGMARCEVSKACGRRA